MGLGILRGLGCIGYESERPVGPFVTSEGFVATSATSKRVMGAGAFAACGRALLPTLKLLLLSRP